jgi:acid phosphatase (class A)
MTGRKLTLALSILALSAGGNAFAAEFNFLKPHQVELTRLVPPPPVPGSEAEKRDMAGVLEVQKTRTPEQSKRALQDNRLSIYVYDDVLGPNFKAANLPVLDAFFKTLHADARTLLSQTKDVMARKRPHLNNPEVKPLDPNTRLQWGYPSGGVMNSTLTAIVLGEMMPEKRSELFERNLEYGNNRVVVGVHYPRDVIGGQMAGVAAAQAFFDTPAFVKEFGPARDELRRVLGYPAAPAGHKSIDEAIASGTLGATPTSSNPPK